MSAAAEPESDGESEQVRSEDGAGRFTPEEQRCLVTIIKDDDELLRCFMHSVRARQYYNKSWMHEVSVRFRRVSKTQRSVDAIRHHFMLRRVPARDRYHALSLHARNCAYKGACTRCLMFERCLVHERKANCGSGACHQCNDGTVECAKQPQQPQRQQFQQPQLSQVSQQPQQLFPVTMNSQAAMGLAELGLAASRLRAEQQQQEQQQQEVAFTSKRPREDAPAARRFDSIAGELLALEIRRTELLQRVALMPQQVSAPVRWQAQAQLGADELLQRQWLQLMQLQDAHKRMRL